MTQEILPPIRKADPPKEIQIRALAKRYRNARNGGMRLFGFIGGHAEGALDRLPGPVRSGLEAATGRALEISFDAASQTRGSLPDTGTWTTRAMVSATGMAGGFGGLPSALAELPVTTTMIMRAIQGIAAEYGFDPDAADTRAECLQVFASAGPSDEDDGTDLSFLALRTTLTGAAMHKMIAHIAPRLSVVLGQKMAAQTVPVLGAVTGAAVNYSFTGYFQEMAHVTFALRKLAEDTGQDRAGLIEEFRQAL